MKATTVQEVPPEVGGVTPDSKPPSWMMEVVRHVPVVGMEAARPTRAERINATRILTGDGANEC